MAKEQIINERKKKIAFPIIARYNCALRYLIEVGLGQQYIMQPRMTKKTLDIGSRYSPDTVCTPFKTTLGSMIEALESGADTLFMVYGICRLGYYGELQEQILRDLGYQFEFINLAEYTTGKTRDYLKELKRLDTKIHPARLTVTVMEFIKMVEYIDEAEAEYYKNCGFELTKGAYRKAINQFWNDMDRAVSKNDIEEGHQRLVDAFHAIPLKKEEPLRVGVIGEYFTVQDDFSNLELEQKLADMGVEVHRWMNFSHRNMHYSGEKNLNVRIHDLCEYEMGPTSTANIWCARDYAERGFDGIIHVKSAGCTPEIDIMPVLQNIGADYKIPILYLTYDSQTSDTGLMTRLEAFYDMLRMRKKVIR
ncbi:MAG: hypothetical protein LUI07_07390 [Lachnospiraceae bacterium]|nr:hypothetical protein [Lachnospiraceae bacterium]